MSKTQFVPTNTSKWDVSVLDWIEAKAYRFHVAIIKEEEGDFSIVALNLPGLGSIGDTEEECLENFREAAAAMIESYTDSGEAIPWKRTTAEDIPDDAKTVKWIVVNV